LVGGEFGERAGVVGGLEQDAQAFVFSGVKGNVRVFQLGLFRAGEFAGD
jgi:hypothetical protein